MTNKLAEDFSTPEAKIKHLEEQLASETARANQLKINIQIEHQIQEDLTHLVESTRRYIELLQIRIFELQNPDLDRRPKEDCDND